MESWGTFPCLSSAHSINFANAASEILPNDGGQPGNCNRVAERNQRAPQMLIDLIVSIFDIRLQLKIAKH